MGGGDLRVVVMDGGGADDAVRPPGALGQVADGHLDAQGTQVGDGGALLPVRAGDDHARAVEHLGQGRHGHPADAHQVGTPARLHIVADVVDCHNITPYNKRVSVRF